MEAVLWQLVQFVQLVLWCSWSLAGTQAAPTGAFHSQHSAHHVTRAANQVAQAACLETSQISPGQAAILVLHASWVGNGMGIYTFYYLICRKIISLFS